eukprot:CAMPEP_0113528404 /NCGR_PEP_ID=MMETSP0015_2-20120614/1823_1 /TAXON_ID=2838 /ORGANISM="Odontella" /LENGTH=135 /DNA_ID=CAMNT_0000426927 /DNA_START=130 /DNA_END=537 /DNA_ORIENTATION=+ /assembly_acc=CAM_ASM_000160
MAPNTEKEFTLDEVAKHDKQDDCWLIIGNDNTGGPKVFDVTSYLDDHPGGAEVMLDVSGKDADEFFEDIGHSNDAREELKKYQIGVLKLSEEEKAKRKAAAEEAAAKAAGGSTNMIMIIILIVAIALGYYKTQMA